MTFISPSYSLEFSSEPSLVVLLWSPPTSRYGCSTSALYPTSLNNLAQSPDFPSQFSSGKAHILSQLQTILSSHTRYPLPSGGTTISFPISSFPRFNTEVPVCSFFLPLFFISPLIAPLKHYKISVSTMLKSSALP